MKILSLLFATLLVLGCLPNFDQMTEQEKREYWRQNDPAFARELEMYDELKRAIAKKGNDLDYWKTRRSQVQDEYSKKAENLDKLVNNYNIACKDFVSSLNEKQLIDYSNLIDSEKEKNLPKVELCKRKFYKSLTEKNMKDLNNLSAMLEEVNVNSKELEECDKEIELSKEKVTEAAAAFDKVSQIALSYISSQQRSNNYSYTAQPSALSSISQSLNEWEQKMEQRRAAFNNNWNMMQMNSSLNNIARSLNSIDSTLKFGY